jgi:carboxymethylenebutenolidase
MLGPAQLIPGSRGHHAIVVDYFARTTGLASRGEDFDFQPHLSATTLEQCRPTSRPRSSATRHRCLAGSGDRILYRRHPRVPGRANRRLDLDAVIRFYDKLSRARLPRLAEHASSMSVPLLGLFGGDDPTIPAEEIEEFDTALREAGVRHQLITFPRPRHSSTAPLTNMRRHAATLGIGFSISLNICLLRLCKTGAAARAHASSWLNQPTH